jgi:hypothetical protein
VLFLRAADEAHRGHAVAVAVERGLRGLAQFFIVGEAQIVVGAEIEHPAAVGLDLGRLHRGDDALRLEEAGGFRPSSSAARWFEGSAVISTPRHSTS